MPRVSVVMAIYNTERYLRQAVESILAQSYRDLEFIIVDDGSDDGGLELLRTMADSRLRVVSRSHEGFTRALNAGIELATGDYIARMDGDDIAAPRRLEHQVTLLDQYPEIGVVGTACQRIDEGDKFLASWFPPATDKLIRHTMIRHNPFLHPSVTMRRAVLQRAGGYDERYVVAQDYDLWFRMASYCQLANVTEPLMKLRTHSASLSSANQRRALEEGIQIRWRAIRSRGYSISSLRFLVAPCLLWMMPRAARARTRSLLRSGHVVYIE